MTKAIPRILNYFIFFIPFILFGLIALFTSSQYFSLHADGISNYIVLDLLLTIPVVYFLIIRNTKIPKTTVIPIMILGLVVGYSTLPVEHHYYLDMFKSFGVPIIELFVLGYIIFRVLGAIKVYKSKSNPDSDFHAILKETCQEIIPGPFAEFLTSEISVVYYGFLNWSTRELSENQFTYHKKSGSPALFGALIFIVLVETISVHILFLKWSHLAALILTILSVYTIFQLLGFSRSLSKRPITLLEKEVVLRYGILSEVKVNYEDILSIELSRKTLKFDSEVRKLSILGELESHNVIITCKNEQTMHGIYGMTKTFKTLALYVDDRERFKDMILKKIEVNGAVNK